MNAGVSLVGRETCVISVFLLLAVYMARAPNLGNVFVKKGGLAVSATECSLIVQLNILVQITPHV